MTPSGHGKSGEFEFPFFFHFISTRNPPNYRLHLLINYGERERVHFIKSMISIVSRFYDATVAMSRECDNFTAAAGTSISSVKLK